MRVAKRFASSMTETYVAATISFTPGFVAQRAIDGSCSAIVASKTYNLQAISESSTSRGAHERSDESPQQAPSKRARGARRCFGP